MEITKAPFETEQIQLRFRKVLKLCSTNDKSHHVSRRSLLTNEWVLWYLFINSSASDFVMLRSLYQVKACRNLTYSHYRHRVPDVCSIAVNANVYRV